MPNSSLTVDRLVWLCTDCWKHCGRLPALRMEGLRATAEPKSTVRLVGDERWCISSLIRAVFYVAPFSLQVLGPMSQQALGRDRS